MKLVYLGMVELSEINQKKCKQLQAGKLHKEWMKQVNCDWGKQLSRNTGNKTVEVKSERQINMWDILK